MKKLYIVFVLVFCLFSFNNAQAESTTIYLKPIDNRVENIEKAQEKLEKDNETNYKQLKDRLKSISASINTNQLISAQEEYEYQLQVYELKAELWCMDKEGYYSSFNKKTKECECSAGSTFINGRCENELKLRLDNLIGCVKNFGELSYYDYTKNLCLCEEGSQLNKQTGFCVNKNKQTEKPLKTATVKTGEQNLSNVVIQPKEPLEAKIAPNTSHDLLTPTAPVEVKTPFWQKLKNVFLKIKFW